MNKVDMKTDIKGFVRQGLIDCLNSYYNGISKMDITKKLKPVKLIKKQIKDLDKCSYEEVCDRANNINEISRDLGKEIDKSLLKKYKNEIKGRE